MSATRIPEWQLRDLVGDVPAAAFIDALGGLTIYIPKSPGQNRILGRDPEQILTKAGYARLCEAFGGQRVILPNNFRRAGAKEAILREYRKNGGSTRSLAARFRVTERYAQAVLAEEKRRPQQGRLFQS